jgi:hypothetical protein
MTERARALIGRMVVFGDTIGERVGLMFLTYYGAQALTYVSVADVIRRSVCVDLESLPPPGLNLSGASCKNPRVGIGPQVSLEGSCQVAARFDIVLGFTPEG